MKGGGIAIVEPRPLHRPKLGAILHSDPPSFHNTNQDDDVSHPPTSSHNPSPYLMSPLSNESTSPFNKSPWLPINLHRHDTFNGLVGSLIREEGHVYSLAVSGDLLYTGSDSKNIRVWKNLEHFTGFKSSSGLVKAIVISGERIFTGHQDGKIRIWKKKKKKKNHTNTNTNIHQRIGSLPTFRDYVKSSMNPLRQNAVRIKHYDAVSCLSLDEENGLLYSSSWDKTVKVWSVSDSRLLETVDAHCDAVNAVATGFGCCVFTGSADGTVKMWRREWVKEKEIKKTKHVLERVLLEQESAVTALAVNRWSTVVYGGSSDGAVNFWERREKEKYGVCDGGVLRGHKLAVLCVAVAGKLVMSGSADKNVCVWRRDECGMHTWVSILAGHAGPVKCIAAIEEEEEEDVIVEEKYGKGYQRYMVYTGSLDKSVKVWRVTDNYVPELRIYT